MQKRSTWIRTILGFIGVTNVDFVVADSLRELEGAKHEREQHLKPIREEVLRKATLRFGTQSNHISGKGLPSAAPCCKRPQLPEKRTAF